MKPWPNGVARHLKFGNANLRTQTCNGWTNGITSRRKSHTPTHTHTKKKQNKKNTSVQPCARALPVPSTFIRIDLKTHKIFSVHANPLAKTDKMFSLHTETLSRTKKCFNAWNSIRAHAYMTVWTEGQTG